MMGDSVATEHTDERAVVSDIDTHNNESIVTSQQYRRAVSDQCSRSCPAILYQIP